MAAVGPSQIFVTLNGVFRTYTKGGVADGAVNTSSDNFFSSVRNGVTTADPQVVYDRLSSRWFVSMMNTRAPNRILIAVSNGPTITAASSFTFFQFEHDLVGSTPNSDTGLLADQPSLGVDANALYIGINLFDSSGTTWTSATGFVINKANLLAASPSLIVTAFRRMATTAAGPYSPQGVSNMDPNATQGYFIGVDSASLGTLQIRIVGNPAGSPTISGNQTIGSASSPPLPATTFPISVPAKGSTPLPLDGGDDRLMKAEIVNGYIWTAHCIQVDSTGRASTSGGRDGIRFYQINPSGPTLVQAGTLFDSSASNPLSYFAGTIGTSVQGHSIVGATYAGNHAYAGVAAGGRLSGDAAGTLNSTVVYNAGAGAYNVQTSSAQGFQQWGAYSSTVTDPADGQTIWTIQELAANVKGSVLWGVQVSGLMAPPPATPSTASPLSLPAGATSNVTITGTTSGGSGFFDPGSGFPNHIAAAINGGGITVNSATYIDPTHVILNVTVASGAAQTTRTITVTNPDGQTATSRAVFGVSAPSVVAVSPATASLPTGVAGAAYSQAISGSGGSSPYIYSISSGVLPAGLSLNPATGLISGMPASAGSQTFTVQATDAFRIAGNREYTLRIASLISNNFSITLNSRGFNWTPSPGCVGRLVLRTTLTNNGPAINAPVYLKVVTLNKISTNQNPALPDTLQSADNGNGIVGDTQQIAPSLGAGQSTPLPLVFCIGTPQSFSFFFDIFTVPVANSHALATRVVFQQRAVSASGDGSASGSAAADSPTPLLAHFELQLPDEFVQSGTPPNFNQSSDPLSNMALITGPGPQSGPAVAVDPLVSTHIAVAATDYANRAVRVSTSSDGGFTWLSTALSRSLAVTSGIQNFDAAVNPSVAFDSLGHLSVVYTLSDGWGSENAVVISESSDGLNFSPPAAITFHPASEGVIDSRPIVAIRAKVGRYVAWDTFSIANANYSINLVRSEEGGAFGPITTVVGNGLVSSPALALSKTRVYIGWDDWGFNSRPPYNTGGQLMITSSPHGAQLKFDAPQQIAATNIGFGRKITAMPEEGARPSLGLAVPPNREDAVYAVFADSGNGTDVFFASSVNQGKKWQIVTTVNNDRSAADQFSPAIAVDTDGNIHVSFYDTRLSSTFETAHVFVAESTDGQSFSNERVTTALSDDSKTNPFRDYVSNLGDRTAIAIIDNDALVAWADTRLGSEDIFASIVFDPYGAYLTGAGKIASPGGALSGNPAVAGIGEFGFEFKYRKGSSVPLGSTEFTLKSSQPQSQIRFTFDSTSYDSVLISGANAQFSGSGKINGAGDYSFVVIMKDGSRAGGGGVDGFRIQIVDKITGLVIYDNVPGSPVQIGAASPEAISEGAIRIY